MSMSKPSGESVNNESTISIERINWIVFDWMNKILQYIVWMDLRRNPENKKRRIGVDTWSNACNYILTCRLNDLLNIWCVAIRCMHCKWINQCYDGKIGSAQHELLLNWCLCLFSWFVNYNWPIIIINTIVIIVFVSLLRVLIDDMRNIFVSCQIIILIDLFFHQTPEFYGRDRKPILIHVGRRLGCQCSVSVVGK